MPDPSGTALSKSARDMTVAELQSEIGRLQSILHWKVMGDPRECVVIPTTWYRGGTTQ